MATSSTLRINALDGPSRQILHAFPSSGMRRRFFRSWLTGKGEPFTENAHGKPIRSPGPGTHGKVAGILRRCSCGVKRKDTIPSSRVASRFMHLRTPVRGAKKFPAKIFFPPLQPSRACPQSVLLTFESKGQAVLVCGKGCGAPSQWRSSLLQSCLQPGRSNNRSKAGIQTPTQHLNLLVAQLLRAKRKRAKTPRLLLRLYPSFTNFGIAKTICYSLALAGGAPWTMLRH
jgi:hypothetical protein